MHEGVKRSFGKRVVCSALAVALAGFGFGMPQDAMAVANNEGLAATGEKPDVMLAVFTNSENDATNTFYMSSDGKNFERISEAFVDRYPNDPILSDAVGSGYPGSPVTVPSGWQREYVIYGHKCPSIIWHNGYFWMLSNESHSQTKKETGRQYLNVMISNSKDLVHWSDPRHVEINIPDGWTDNGEGKGQFDAAAADWSVGPDGNIYLVVTIGRYGGYHDRPQDDAMFPYVAKITRLTATNDPAYNPIHNDSSVIQVEVEQAVPVILPVASADRLDGSWYFENGFAYLSIKENGVRNEIWKITAVDLSNGRANDANMWTLVNNNVVTGYEAPSLTKFRNSYYMFTDELADWTPNDNIREPYMVTGTHMQQSSVLEYGWSEPTPIYAYKSNGQQMSGEWPGSPDTCGPRHGTVITVTDPAAKEIIWNLRASEGFTGLMPGQVDPESGYLDVHRNDWFFDAVAYVREKDIMTGLNNWEFGSWKTLDRAMMATLLWRIDDPTVSSTYDPNATTNTTGLPDVEDRAWYTGAANWALASGVIHGLDTPNGTTFGANTPVTREMLVTMLANYINPDLTSIDYSKFNALEDSKSTSDWARPATAWAVEQGILSGTDYGLLEPGRAVRREEAAAVIMNAMEAGLLTSGGSSAEQA